jgi:endonuclease/exonuclease/phosphatase family metal-dependent hydrolase
MAKVDRLVICVALLASAGLGCKKDDPPDGPGVPISVFTHNLYLGSEITPLAMIPSPDQVPVAAAAIWANIQASNFPERAKVLAQQIVTLGPDLVALQEVTLYRRQVPSDIQPGAAPNATEVVLDFLDLLMTELAARGGTYHVVGEASNVDAELPVDDGNDGLFDLRLTDRDVMLAKDGIETANFAAFPFAAKFSFMAGGSGGYPIALTRSWSRADAVVGGAAFTFANAHLEISGLLQPIQTAQAMEMLAGVASVPDPVLFLGDFNSEPGMNSYPLLAAQFEDAWDDKGSGEGFTCCQAADLMNAPSSAADRIDLVLYRGRFRVNDIRVTGTDPAVDRTPGGLWPSDHFGVLSQVELVP